jgi:hypothetical protein
MPVDALASFGLRFALELALVGGSDFGVALGIVII